LSGIRVTGMKTTTPRSGKSKLEKGGESQKYLGKAVDHIVIKSVVKFSDYTTTHGGVKRSRGKNKEDGKGSGRGGIEMLRYPEGCLQVSQPWRRPETGPAVEES